MLRNSATGANGEHTHIHMHIRIGKPFAKFLASIVSAHAQVPRPKPAIILLSYRMVSRQNHCHSRPTAKGSDLGGRASGIKVDEGGTG
jgi:hypothetical protein